MKKNRQKVMRKMKVPQSTDFGGFKNVFQFVEDALIVVKESRSGRGGGRCTYLIRWAIASRLKPRKYLHPSRELSGDVTLDSDWLTKFWIILNWHDGTVLGYGIVRCNVLR